MFVLYHKRDWSGNERMRMGFCIAGERMRGEGAEVVPEIQEVIL